MLDRRSWLALFVSIFIAIGAYWIWFFKWDIYTWGDWGFYFPETSREFVASPQVWSSSFFGGIDISLPLYPFVRLLPGLLSYMMPAFKALHIIYFLPSVAICSISSFLLARYIHKSNLSGFIGSLVYTFNTYFLIIRGGHLPLVNAFAVAPLAILAFLHGLRSSRTYFFVLSGVLISLSAAYEVRAAYLLFSLLFFLGFFYIRVVSRKTLFKSLTTLLTAAILNLYWILGLFLSGGETTDLPIFHRQLYGAGYSHIVRSAVLQLYQWGSDGLIGPGIQPTPKYLWTIPFFVFLELYLSRKNRTIVYFGIVSLAGIFFSKMLSQPFPYFYQWMFDHFPGFSIFREPSKFFFLIALGYSVLLSGLAHRIWINWHNTSIQKIFRILLIILISAPFLLNTRGVITGKLGELLKPRQIPQDYILLKQFVLDQPEFFRTLYFPYSPRWGIWTDSKPALNGISLLQSDWSKLNNYLETGLDYSYIGEISNIFKKDFSDKLFDMSSVKYVIIPLQDMGNNDDMFAIYGSRDSYQNLIESQPFLRKINIGINQLQIYENFEHKPHLYLTTQPDSIYTATISATKISSIRRSATEYQFKLGEITDTVYLNFTDLYHPGWKISPEPISWLNVVLGKQHFIPDSNHFPNTALMNTFALTPSTITPQIYTLYFRPQAYLELGLFISAVGYVFILPYLLLTSSKNFLHD